jgi:hypothetical protein
MRTRNLMLLAATPSLLTRAENVVRYGIVAQTPQDI